MKCDKWLHIYGNKLGTGVNCEWVDDVRENVRGEWIRGDSEKLTGKIRCSVCGESCYKGEYFFNFCPNCGAEMRAKE